jgi:hypothetical protein
MQLGPIAQLEYNITIGIYDIFQLKYTFRFLLVTAKPLAGAQWLLFITIVDDMLVTCQLWFLFRSSVLHLNFKLVHMSEKQILKTSC